MPFHQSWLTREYSVLFKSVQLINSSGFYLCLADSSTLNESSPIADYIVAEPSGGGYVRQPVTFTGDAIFDNTKRAIVYPSVSATWTPIATPLQFQTVFLIANGALTGTPEAIVAFFKEPLVRFRSPGSPYTATLVMERSI